MTRKLLFSIFAITFYLSGFSQAMLRDTSIQIISFQFGYGSFLTAANMDEKANLLHNFGPSLSFKTSNNWLIQSHLNLFLGHKSLENETANMVFSEIGLPINSEGLLEEVGSRFQGFAVCFDVGKLIIPSDYNKNSGLWLSAGLGFIQHRLKFVYGGQLVTQLEEPYVKGYDRLTNGLLINQFIGYRRYSNKNNFNYTIGIEINEGLTQNRRSWNYDTFDPMNEARLDMYYGLKFNVILPFYGVSN